MKLYLAGGLFNAGERLHNLMLEKHLKLLGHEVILPQREARQFYKDGHFDLRAVRALCKAQASQSDVVVVANFDGPDADSGTAVEHTVAIMANGSAVTYRTDFRTAPEEELGLNAMLLLEGTEFIYLPCSFTELDQVEEYYALLAVHIVEEVTALAP